MGNCCVCGADDFADDWQRWDDHPARRQWEVLKDLGAGAGSQVRGLPAAAQALGATTSPRLHLESSAAARSRAPADRPLSTALRCRAPPPQVVLARHRASGELAALKVVFLECPTFAGDEEHLATLQRCVRACARLLPVLGAGDERGLRMAACAGRRRSCPSPPAVVTPTASSLSHSCRCSGRTCGRLANIPTAHSRTLTEPLSALLLPPAV